MRYRNKETGIILEPRDPVVEQQLKSDDRYEEHAREPVASKPLSQMNKAELLAMAARAGIGVVPEGATNDEIRKMIDRVLG